MKKYPIWVNDLSGEYTDGFDETSERPIINATELTEKMLIKYFLVNILVRCEEFNLWGVANIDENEELSVLVFWKNRKWQINKDFIGKNKIIIESVPSIKGRSNLRFEYDLKLDKGRLID